MADGPICTIPVERVKDINNFFGNGNLGRCMAGNLCAKGIKPTGPPFRKREPANEVVAT